MTDEQEREYLETHFYSGAEVKIGLNTEYSMGGIIDWGLQDQPEVKEYKPEPVPRFEDLDPTVVKGFDNFRAYMRKHKLNVVFEGGYCLEVKYSNIVEMWGIMMGFLMAAGATYKQACEGMTWAYRVHNLWVKQEFENVPDVDHRGRPFVRSRANCTFIG